MTPDEMAQQIHRLTDKTERLEGVQKLIFVMLCLILVGIILTLFLQWRMPSTAPAPMPSVSGNSVTIGAAGENPQRDWLTSGEVAKREGVAARTVLFWIDRGEIEPMPIKNESGDWRIAANYRRLPQVAATNPDSGDGGAP